MCAVVRVMHNPHAITAAHLAGIAMQNLWRFPIAAAPWGALDLWLLQHSIASTAHHTMTKVWKHDKLEPMLSMSASTVHLHALAPKWSEPALTKYASGMYVVRNA